MATFSGDTLDLARNRAYRQDTPNFPVLIGSLIGSCLFVMILASLGCCYVRKNIRQDTTPDGRLQQLESVFSSRTFVKWHKSDQRNRPGGMRVDMEDQVCVMSRCDQGERLHPGFELPTHLPYTVFRSMVLNVSRTLSIVP